MVRQVKPIGASWRWRHNLEAIAQLKLDLHDSLGRLLTRCHEMAQADRSCADYWTSEAGYWEDQYHAAMKISDELVASIGHQPSASTPTVPTQVAVPQRMARLQAALLAAFDEAGLRQMVQFELSVDLDQIAGGQDLEEKMFHLIAWAIRVNRVADLIAGAQRANPTNAELRTLGGMS